MKFKPTTKYKDYTYSLVTWNTEKQRKNALFVSGWPKEWTYADKEPNCIGIKCGATNDLFVVDADSTDVVKRIESFGVKPSVITAKGAHFYFHHQPELKTSAKPVDNIDTRGEGGLAFQGSYWKDDYTVEYDVIDETQQDMPKSLFNYLVSLGFGVKTNVNPAAPSAPMTVNEHKGLTNKQEELINDLVCRSNNAIVSTRSDVDYSVVCKMIELGLSKDEIENKLSDIGKFKERGKDYFETTYNKAINNTQHIPNKPTTKRKEESKEMQKYQALDLDGKYIADIAVDYFNDDIRYDARRATWYRWVGTHWYKTVKEEIKQMIIQSIESIKNVADSKFDIRDKRYVELIKFAHRYLSNSNVEATLEMVKSYPEVLIKEEVMNKDLFLVNVKNGTYNLKTKELQPHNKGDYITQIIDIDYNPNAKCDNFKKWLNIIFKNDKALIDYVQEALGYSLSGSTDARNVFFCYGKGKNGKTVFADVINKIFNDYKDGLTDEMYIQQSNGKTTPVEILHYEYSRVLFGDETPEDSKLNTKFIKNFSGGGEISTRIYHTQTVGKIRPKAKMWILGNFRPAASSTDQALWDRLRLIPFTHRFNNPEAKQKVLARLLEEKEGILKWMIDGWSIYEERFLTVLPEAIRSTTQEYRDDYNDFQKFVADACIIDPESRIKAKELFQIYNSWAKENGCLVCTSDTKFGRMLSGVDNLIKRRLNDGAYYFGISLKKHGKIF